MIQERGGRHHGCHYIGDNWIVGPNALTAEVGFKDARAIFQDSKKVILIRAKLSQIKKTSKFDMNRDRIYNH